MKRLCQKFYVYEHWRPDKDLPFYVGKGTGKRAYDVRKRNQYYNRIVSKLAKLGMCVEVRLVESALFETEAFKLEVERIAFWRASGVKLANCTNGGDGTAGLKWPEKSKKRQKLLQKKRMSDLTMRVRISKKLKGHQLTGDALENYLAAMLLRRGIKKGPMSDKQKRKIARAKRGSKATLETRAKMRKAREGFRWSEEVKSKMAASAKIAQKLRFEKEMKTKKGQQRVKLRMTELARKGRGTPEYSEQKRRACLIGWEKRRRSVVSGLS